MSKTRKSPSDSATKYSVGTKKKGNDGNLWEIVQTKNKVNRWKLVSDVAKSKSSNSSKTKTMKVKEKVYFTHHNGSRPYKVIVNGNNIKIYKLRPDFDVFTQPSPQDYTVLIKEYKKVKNVFVGKSIKGDDAHIGSTTREAQKFGLGNSILIYLSKSNGKYEYSFIGDCAFEFKTNDEILEYYSMIDRNDAPLPVAVGKENIYFLISYGEYGYVSREEFVGFPKPYGWGLHSYYRLWTINEFDGAENISNDKVKKIKNIKKLDKK